MPTDPIAQALQQADRRVPAPAFRPVDIERLEQLAGQRRRRRVLLAAAAALLAASVLLLLQSSGGPAAEPPAHRLAARALGRELARLRAHLSTIRCAGTRARQDGMRTAAESVARARIAVERSALCRVALGESLLDSAAGTDHLRRITTLFPQTLGAARAERALDNSTGKR